MIATKKFLFPVFALSFVLLFLIMSCNEPNISENAADENLGNALMKDSSLFGSDKKPWCGSMDVVEWRFDHYSPIENKSLGVWPRANATKNDFINYSRMWGMKKILVQSENGVNWALDVDENGEQYYQEENILFFLGHNPDDDIQTINYFNNLLNFCIDEPFERDEYTYQQLFDLSLFLETEYPEKKLFITSWSIDGIYHRPRQQYILLINNTVNTYMQCDEYFTSIFAIWDIFKNYFSNKNVSNWVHSLFNKNIFEQFFANADLLNISALWFFIGTEGSQSNIDEFSFVAWQNYWLRKYERKYIIEYRCSKPNPCDCDKNNINDGWYVYKEWRMNDLREVYPGINSPDN